MTEMPNLSKVRALGALAGAGSFSLAAERLGLTKLLAEMALAGTELEDFIQKRT